MTCARILLVDDHELFREGLAGLINSQLDMEVVGQAGDGLEALSLARSLQPDLVVMDIKMPLCDGLEGTRLIRAELPQAPILMLTIYDEEEKLFEAIKAGANGYVLKETNSANFLRAVRRTLVGEATLPPKLAARLLEEFVRLQNQSPPQPADKDTTDLTHRERQVLDLIAIGATDKEIAGQLCISLHTVKSHVRSILNKMHAVNRRHAARLAARQGLLRNIT
jgi:DNA-binding NarL/FixJ family response regulator